MDLPSPMRAHVDISPVAPFAAVFSLLWGASIALGSWVGKFLPWGAMNPNEFNTWMLAIASAASVVGAAGVGLWQKAKAAKRSEDQADENAHQQSLSGKLEAATTERAAILAQLKTSESDRENLRKKLDETQDRLDRLYTGLPTWLLAKIEPAAQADATPCPIQDPNDDRTPVIPIRPASSPPNPTTPPPTSPPSR